MGSAQNNYYNAGGGLKRIKFALTKFLQDSFIVFGFGTVLNIIIDEIIEKHCGTSITEYFAELFGCTVTYLFRQTGLA